MQAGLVYWLGKTLYVSLTNRARGLTLVASRGPAFAMPEASGFAPLASEPSVDDVVSAVLDAYANDQRKKSVGVDVGRTRRADGGEARVGVEVARSARRVEDNLASCLDARRGQPSSWTRAEDVT